MEHTASSVILIRPTGFGHDPETAASNAFQQLMKDPEVVRLASDEFDGLLDVLRHCGVDTRVLDPVDRHAPNAVFPNNWFSTHADGTVVLYPMLTPSRRRERPASAQGMMDLLHGEGLLPRSVMDLSAWEQQGRILEGTGSLVLDRSAKKAYACLSPRTTEDAVREWCRLMDHTPILFSATMDGTLTGQPVYHTNVVMCIGGRFALVCLEAVPYPAEREELTAELHAAGKEIIPITRQQMHSFVGNMLELAPRDPSTAPFGSRPLLLLSETAFHALHPLQRMALERHTALVPVAVPTIERVGGGSVRCMLAENFLPRP